MMRLKIFIFLSFFIFSLSVWSQSDNTNSHYWQLGDHILAPQRAMGGIGYGLRYSQMINPLNPSSFSTADSMTFMLDLGLKGQIDIIKDLACCTARSYNASLAYIALQFHLMKNLVMGAGLEPLSFIDYQYNVCNDIAYRDWSDELSEVYTTLSYCLFDRLSFGMNVGYLFGNIYDRSATFRSDDSCSVLIDALCIHRLMYEVGLQYVHRLKKNKELICGAVYVPQIQYAKKEVYIANPVKDNSEDSTFHVPEIFGVGFTVRRLNKLTIGADFQYQRWTAAEFYSRTDSLSNRMRINAGAEYIPNAINSCFFEKIRYRTGFSYANSYIINHSKYKEYDIALGLGIPMVDRRSFVNTTFEYSFLKPQDSAFLNEQHLKFIFSYTFNELWFFNRKLQ